ncbi:MAG TPA: DinB family protein [Terracidiphilus sp.]|nr:DinB family protein [Terracidiphilus sp.]
MENRITDASVAEGLPGGPDRVCQPSSSLETGKRATTLHELENQFAAICGKFQTMVATSGADVCSRPPAPGSWSAAECIQHLSLSADAYFPVWQQVIASAGPRKAEMNAPYQIDFWGRFLCWILEPPARIRSKTPAPFQPIDCGKVDEVLDGFLDRQERVIAALRRCRGRAIDQVKMASPIDSRIRYSIWSSFMVNAAHQRRHLWQAEQAIARVQAAN